MISRLRRLYADSVERQVRVATALQVGSQLGIFDLNPSIDRSFLACQTGGIAVSSSSHDPSGPRSLLVNESERTDAVITILPLAISSSRSLRALLGLKLAPLGLASGQDRLLLVLEEHGCMSVSELADKLNVRASTVSKMADRLQKMGFATRVPHNLDGRRTILLLSDSGRSICHKLRAVCDAVEDELKTDLNADEIRRVADGLALLDNALGRRLKRLR